MSASLVGSEMCIRDSTSAFAAPKHIGPSSGRSQSLSPRVARIVDSSPVSYTHLTLPTICSV
eukprot:1866720-Alexandrium_andersonii.AAC.1